MNVEGSGFACPESTLFSAVYSLAVCDDHATTSSQYRFPTLFVCLLVDLEGRFLNPNLKICTVYTKIVKARSVFFLRLVYKRQRKERHSLPAPTST